MASIHKDPRDKSPFFYCAFTLPNGKRCFKSTKLKDRDAAMAFCLRMQEAAQKAAGRNFPEEQARKILNEIRELSGDSAIRFPVARGLRGGMAAIKASHCERGDVYPLQRSRERLFDASR